MVAHGRNRTLVRLGESRGAGEGATGEEEEGKVMGGAVDRLGNDDGRVARELTPSRPCRWLLRRQPRARKKHRKQGTRPPKLRSPLRTTRPVLGATPPPTPLESAPTQATS